MPGKHTSLGDYIRNQVYRDVPFSIYFLGLSMKENLVKNDNCGYETDFFDLARNIGVSQRDSLYGITISEDIANTWSGTELYPLVADISSFHFPVERRSLVFIPEPSFWAGTLSQIPVIEKSTSQYVGNIYNNGGDVLLWKIDKVQNPPKIEGLCYHLRESLGSADLYNFTQKTSGDSYQHLLVAHPIKE